MSKAKHAEKILFRIFSQEDFRLGSTTEQWLIHHLAECEACLSFLLISFSLLVSSQKDEASGHGVQIIDRLPFSLQEIVFKQELPTYIQMLRTRGEEAVREHFAHLIHHFKNCENCRAESEELQELFDLATKEGVLPALLEEPTTLQGVAMSEQINSRDSAPIKDGSTENNSSGILIGGGISEGHFRDEPVVLIIGADIERCEHLAYAFAQEGYEVLIPDGLVEMRKAIIETMPHLILLDYTPETHAAGMTVPSIALFLGGDGLGCAPPLLVVASSVMQAHLPRLPGVYHIVSPASLDLLFAVVRETINV